MFIFRFVRDVWAVVWTTHTTFNNTHYLIDYGDITDSKIVIKILENVPTTSKVVRDWMVSPEDHTWYSQSSKKEQTKSLFFLLRLIRSDHPTNLITTITVHRPLDAYVWEKDEYLITTSAITVTKRNPLPLSGASEPKKKNTRLQRFYWRKMCRQIRLRDVSE